MSPKNFTMIFSAGLTSLILSQASISWAEATTVASKQASSLASSDHRTHVSYTLEIQPVGIAAGTNHGIMAGYFLRPNSVVMLKYENAQELTGLFDNYKAHSDLVSITGREFLGNSFYTEIGLAGRKRTIMRRNDKIEISSLTSNSSQVVKTESHYDRSDLGLVFGIGNQWQWSSFTLGCEWVGLYVPLTSTQVRGSKKETRADGVVTHISMDRKDEQKTANLRLLNLHLGFSF